MSIRGDIIFIYKILWNVFKADYEKFWLVHRHGQVKVADVKNDKARMAAGEYAVDDKFDKFERACRCADVREVADSISSNGDSGSVGIFFVSPIIAYNFGVRDLVTAIVGDIFVSDNPERISSLKTLLFGDVIPLTYAWA